MSKRKDIQTRPGKKEEAKESQTARLIVVGALILIVLGGITAITMTGKKTEIAPPDPDFAPVDMQYDPITNRHWHAGHGHWHEGPPPETNVLATGGDGVPAPPHVTDPKPWQYDEITNSHYDPGHGHWHAGKPPAGVDEFVLSSPFTSDMVDAPPGIINPQPWMYDEASNKHYHPGHAHWHAGPPPPVEERN